MTIKAGATVWVQWVSSHFTEYVLEDECEGRVLRDYYEPELKRDVLKLKSEDMLVVRSKKDKSLAIIPVLYPVYTEKDLKEKARESLVLIGEVLTKVHFRLDWEKVYNEADWYFFVYRFDRAGRKELYAFIQNYIRKPDGTTYETKDLRKLGDSRLKAMFKKYKPSAFGRHPKDL